MNEIQAENEFMLISLETINKLFKSEYGADSVSLYMFYYKQCKMQGTNQSKTVSEFVKKGLGWGDIRFKNAKDVLKSLGLIEDIQTRDDRGVISGHYIRLNYIKSSTHLETQGMGESIGGSQETNAGSSTNNINAGSSTNKKEELSPFEKMLSDFKQHRKELKKPMTSLAVDRLRKKLSVYSEDTAIAMMDKAITKGWQDVYPDSLPDKKASEGFDSYTGNQYKRLTL